MLRTGEKVSVTLPFLSPVLQEASERGFLYQGTDLARLDARLVEGPITLYLGVDATAESLHVGHLVPIMLLRLFQRHGHRPLALVGGGTSKIGDPSFRNTTRPMLSEEELARNIQGIHLSYAPYIRFGTRDHDGKLVDNADWLDRLEYIPFLREIGRHFPMGRLLSLDSVKQKLENNLPFSFLEFNYPLLQAYDFLELLRHENCVLQIGGSDQWGNIVSGVEFIRRMTQTEVFAITTPLLETASGAKMGKTAQGAVWLRPEFCSPFDFWQYWRNVDDRDVGRFLRLFTDLPLEEIAVLEKAEDINATKKILADSVTALTHGQEVIPQIHQAVQALFYGSAEGGDQIPTFLVPRNWLGTNTVVDLLAESGLCSSRGEARRLIRGGGAYLNDTSISSEEEVLTAAQFPKGRAKVASGKKHFLYACLQE
ncbi:MAG: tyrosine--tRNA ligase [Holosporales bacterium]|jgi:tyrosyl-tRNA synthetase|nr:tyrosine--tRNA ligase [Holosporales bacterium]